MPPDTTTASSHNAATIALLHELLQEKKQQILDLRHRLDETTDRRQLIRLSAQLELLNQEARSLVNRTRAILREQG